MVYLIAGIDAGINTGYALLDLKGNLVASGCVKEAGTETLVGIITQYGIPVLVASDTSPPSHFVQKLAARFNVRVFQPHESLGKLEKREMGSGILNPHVRDGYAAAVKAYHKYENRLRQIESMPGVLNKDELKRMAIIGKRIADAKGMI